MSAFLDRRPHPAWLLCLVVVAALGCDDEWRTVELDLVSLAATDSIGEGQALEVQFGYYAAGEDQFSSHRWEAVDPTTFRLRVFYRFDDSDPAIGAPAFLTSSSVVLESPPAETFTILAGELSLEVQGGAEPRPADRLTVRLTESGQPLEGVTLQLIARGRGATPLPPTDARGITRIFDVCPGPTTRFAIESIGDRAQVLATARWPRACDAPLRLAVPGRALAKSDGP